MKLDLGSVDALLKRSSERIEEIKKTHLDLPMEQLAVDVKYRYAEVCNS